LTKICKNEENNNYQFKNSHSQESCFCIGLAVCEQNIYKSCEQSLMINNFKKKILQVMDKSIAFSR